MLSVERVQVEGSRVPGVEFCVCGFEVLRFYVIRYLLILKVLLFVGSWVLMC